jgi:hypothetical protein
MRGPMSTWPELLAALKQIQTLAVKHPGEKRKQFDAQIRALQAQIKRVSSRELKLNEHKRNKER